jgi:hypothetical protein
MLQLEHKRRIVDACFPASLQEANELWHDIKPVKFGKSQFFPQPPLPSTNFVLAAYQVPEDAAYMLILRAECYVTSFFPTSPAFGRFMPPPQGIARWTYTDIDPTTPEYKISPNQSIHIYADSDEVLFAKGDHRIALTADVTPVTDATLVIRTLIYAYLIGALVADKIGASESTYFTSGPVDFAGGNFPPSPAPRPPIAIGEF